MFIKYRVDYWDEIDEQSATDTGLVCAKDMNGILNNLKKYYGQIDELTVQFLDDADGTNVLTKEDVMEIFNAD